MQTLFENKLHLHVVLFVTSYILLLFWFVKIQPFISLLWWTFDFIKAHPEQVQRHSVVVKHM